MKGCALIGLINILCVLWMSHFCNANKRETFHKKNRSREGSTSGPKNITKNRLSCPLDTSLENFLDCSTQVLSVTIMINLEKQTKIFYNQFTGLHSSGVQSM